MMPVLQFLFGHAVFAVGFYSTHRWILHGPLGRFGPLKSWRKQHTEHHRHPQDPGGLLFTPEWNAFLLGACSAILLVYPAVGFGVISYVGLYTWRHRRAHSGAEDPTALHHLSHHYKNPRKNFDIVYPIIDRIFRTSAPQS